MATDLQQFAEEFGLRPTQVLQEHGDRLVARVEDEQGSEYVIKVAEEPDAFAGDLEGIRVLERVGVPVPGVVAYQAGPPAAVVLEWIDGEPLCFSSSAVAQRDVGRLLRLVHSLPAGDTFSGQSTIQGWVRTWVNEIAAWWPSVGGTRSQIQYLRDWFDDLTPLLAGREGSLTLFDGRADHFLIHDERVAGVIDLHDVGSGDPAMDLAVIGLDDDRLIPGVLEGYGSDESQARELESLIPFYLLLRRLAGSEWQLRVGSTAAGSRLLHLAVASVKESG